MLVVLIVSISIHSSGGVMYAVKLLGPGLHEPGGGGPWEQVREFEGAAVCEWRTRS